MPQTQTKQNSEVIFQVPTLKKFKVVDLELLDPEKAEEEAKKLREKTLPELHKQIQMVLAWLEGTRLKLKEFGRKSREAQELAQNDIDQAQKEVAKKQKGFQAYLNHEFGPFRRTAWVATLEYYFSKEVISKAVAQKRIASLCEKEYLQETDGGPLEIFGKHYSVKETADLGDPEMRQLREAARQLVNRAEKAERLAQQNKLNALLEEGKLSTIEFLGNKSGFFAVETSVNGNAPDGVLLVKSSNAKIYPRKAIGSFQADIEELQQTGRYLLLHTLDWEAISKEFFIQKAQFSEREAELLTTFWMLLKNGIARKGKREMVQSLRDNYRADSNLTPAEFFAGKSDSCLLELEGSWNWYDPKKKQESRIHNLFFLIERRETAEKVRVITLLKFPAWLNDLFAGYRNKSFPEGMNFDKLPPKLRQVLQAIHNQVKKHSQIQNHS